MSVGHLNLPMVIKEESPYEAEINAAAAKIKEAIKREAAKTASALTKLSMTNIGQPNAKSPLQLQNIGTKNLTQNQVETVVDDVPIDDDSQKGHFGWATFGKTYIPYILRRSEKFCALRMVEMELPPNHLNFLRSNLSDCTYVKGNYITAAESRLLNEINFKHLDCKYSIRAFTVHDKIVTLADAKEFVEFLNICYCKRAFGKNAHVPNKCGFIRINNDSERLVAFIVRGEQKLVPFFYFEGENIENMRLEYVSGWDFSYFKFCFKVQGITDEYYPGDSLEVVAFTDIQKYFNEFEDYWPNVGDPILASTSRNKNTSLQHFTKMKLQNPTPDKQPQQHVSIFPGAELSVAPKNNHQVRRYSPYVTANVQMHVEPSTYEHQLLLPTLQNYNSSSNNQAQHYHPRPVMMPSSIFNPGQVTFLPTLHFPTVPSQVLNVTPNPPSNVPNPKFNVIVKPSANVPNPVLKVIPKPPSNVPNPRLNVTAKPSVNVSNPVLNVIPKPPPDTPNPRFNVIAKPSVNVPNPVLNVITKPPSNVQKRLSNTKPRDVFQADNVAPKNNRRFRRYSPYPTDYEPRPREMLQNVYQALTKGWLSLSQTVIQQNVYPIQPMEVIRIADCQSE